MLTALFALCLHGHAILKLMSLLLLPYVIHFLVPCLLILALLFIQADKLAQINWEEWLHAPGMPSFDPNKVLDRSLVVACDALAAKWAKGQDGKTATADDLKALQVGCARECSSCLRLR